MSDGDRRQAGAEEIEITPKMLAAGIIEYSSRETDWLETEEELIARIYKAMVSAKKAD